MTWAKLDDQFHANKKLALLDPDKMLPALGLHMLALSWVASELTDGFIPKNQVRRLGADSSAFDLANELVRAVLWEPAEGGFQIHDYLDYNPSREQVLAAQAAKSEAGKLGAARRWNKRDDGTSHGNTHGNRHGTTHSTSHSDGTSHGTCYGTTDGKAMADGCPVPVPVPVPQEGSVLEEPPPSDVAGAREADPDGGGGGDDSEKAGGDDPLLWDLWDLPCWKRDDRADRELLRVTAAESPRASMAAVFADYRLAASEHPPDRPRAYLRKIAQRIHGQQPAPRASPEPVEPLPEIPREEQIANVRKARQEVEKLAATRAMPGGAT